MSLRIVSTFSCPQTECGTLWYAPYKNLLTFVTGLVILLCPLHRLGVPLDLSHHVPFTSIFSIMWGTAKEFNKYL